MDLSNTADKNENNNNNNKKKTHKNSQAVQWLGLQVFTA